MQVRRTATDNGASGKHDHANKSLLITQVLTKSKELAVRFAMKPSGQRATEDMNKYRARCAEKH
eukprot:1997187-Amphidinium_carterae.1